MKSRIETGDHWVLYATVDNGKLEVHSLTHNVYAFGRFDFPPGRQHLYNKQGLIGKLRL